MSTFQFNIETPDDAQQAIKNAAGAGAISAGITAFVAVLALLDVQLVAALNGWMLIDAGIIAGLAYSVYRRSRIGAVGLLAYHILGQVVLRMDGTLSGGLLMALLFAYFYVQGIRGTFAYHRMMKDRTSDPIEVINEDEKTPLP